MSGRRRLLDGGHAQRGLPVAAGAHGRERLGQLGYPQVGSAVRVPGQPSVLVRAWYA